MGTICEWTFFLALGLLAVVVTVFVLAVSLLGRALETAAREQEKTTKEQKEAVEDEIADIQQQISALTKRGRIDKEKLKELDKQLKQLMKEDERFGKRLGRIGKAPEPLTVKGGVVIPGVSLLVALILNGVAWYFWYLSTISVSAIQIFNWIFYVEPLSVFMWIASLAAILYSIFRIYKSLRAVEKVAVTSEEAALRKQVEAFKLAQKEIEEEKKPELKLIFKGKDFPLRVKSGSEVKLPLELRIIRGEVAEDLAIHICLSPGFDFPKQTTYTLDPDHDYPNYICISWQRTGRLIRGLVANKTITIKSPKSKGSFKIVYFIFCRGFRSEPIEREIIVE